MSLEMSSGQTEPAGAARRSTNVAGVPSCSGVRCITSVVLFRQDPIKRGLFTLITRLTGRGCGGGAAAARENEAGRQPPLPQRRNVTAIKVKFTSV